VPELPEVETVRLGLNKLTLGQPIQAVEVLLDRTIAHPLTPDFLTALTGCTIRQWHRRGKYLLAELASSEAEGTPAKAVKVNPRGNAPPTPNRVNAPPTSQPPAALPASWLGVHLRMTGKLLWLDSSTEVEKHTRVRFLFADNQELRFVDQRTFGQMWWVPPDRGPQDIITGLQRLGPEPFAAEFSDAYFAAALKGRSRPIKNALLDQELVAGVGNIYADESLFLSKIHPLTLCAQLTKPQLKVLRQNVIQVLQDSIAARGTTFSDYRDISGVNGNYGGIAWVYGRAGAPCKVCGTPIERLKLAGRSAHFCPRCQPQPRQAKMTSQKNPAI
jgi:formamidopyrimidine-DNA glycosylase